MKKVILFLCVFLFPFSVMADSSKASVVMEMSSGRVLLAKQAHQKRLIASITKIMTCIVVLENVSLEEKVTVGEEVLKMYGTNIYLEVGEVISVKDLLYGLMLRSGNDAAIVLAIRTMGTEEEFVQKMNEKAQEIGMKNTSFENPHGLDEDTQNYSTAYDMALLSQYAYRNFEYRKIIHTKKYQTKSNLKSYLWYNRMSLLSRYEECIGGKNGYTPKAGKTLVSVAKRDNMILTIVTLDDDNLYEHHEALYHEYFSKYSMYQILNQKEFSHLNSDVMIRKSFSYPLTKEEKENVDTLLTYYPKQKNGIVGKILIQLDDQKIGQLELYSKKKEEKSLSFFDKLKRLLLR